MVLQSWGGWRGGSAGTPHRAGERPRGGVCPSPVPGVEPWGTPMAPTSCAPGVAMPGKSVSPQCQGICMAHGASPGLIHSCACPERLLGWDMAQRVDPHPGLVGVWAENREAKTPCFSPVSFDMQLVLSPVWGRSLTATGTSVQHNTSRCWWLEAPHGASV